MCIIFGLLSLTEKFAIKTRLGSLLIYIYYIYIYIVQSTDTCFAVPQLISVAWYNMDMAWQLFIPKRLSVRTACGTIAVMRTSRERKAICGQSAQTTTRVVGFALLRYIYIYTGGGQKKVAIIENMVNVV